MRTVFALIVGCFVCCAASARDNWPAAETLPVHSTFPDPLVMFNGKRVESKREWSSKRAPELRSLIQHYEYGYFPRPAKIKAKVAHTDKNFFGGKATLKLVTISFRPEAAPDIHLMLVIPNERSKPAPVFLGLNFQGNHALVTDTNVPLATGWLNNKYPGVVNNHATEASRGTTLDAWTIEQTIDRGYAVATFHHGDIQWDQPGGPGVRQFIHGSRDPEHDWGTIAAWAWGLHRAVDYLVTDKAIDRKRIAVAGHSRLGKTALLAAAYDERIALAIPSQAGCGGTAPSRSTVGESVERINTSFPHWFCGEFKKFNKQPERLPFDQHCLIALCAPRHVLLSNAAEDTWANPEGQFEMLKAAHPVYALLGSQGLRGTTMPPTGELLASKLGYFIRPGKHSMTGEDWKVFLDFADVHFGKPARKSR